jgi:hypothetical protein
MSAPVLLALDVATRMGWCLGEIDGNAPTFGALRLAPEGASSSAVFGGAFKWVADTVRVHKVNRIVMEAPLDPRHLGPMTTRATGLRLIGLPAVVEAAAYLCGIHSIHEVRADKVRFDLLGVRVKKANAKGKVMAGVQALGFDCTDDDAADALALWLHACKEMQAK